MKKKNLQEKSQICHFGTTRGL